MESKENLRGWWVGNSGLLAFVVDTIPFSYIVYSLETGSSKMGDMNEKQFRANHSRIDPKAFLEDKIKQIQDASTKENAIDLVVKEFRTLDMARRIGLITYDKLWGMISLYDGVLCKHYIINKKCVECPMGSCSNGSYSYISRFIESGDPHDWQALLFHVMGLKKNEERDVEAISRANATDRLIAASKDLIYRLNAATCPEDVLAAIKAWDSFCEAVEAVCRKD